MNRDSVSLQHIKRTIDYLPTLINITRIVVALAVLVFHLFTAGNENIGLVHFHPVPFYIWQSIYILFICVMMIFPQWQIQERALPAPVNLTDILMMSALTYIAGGVETGFAILLLPFIATSCVSHGGRNAWAYAAFATLLLFASVIVDKNHTDSVFVQTGLLSASCFFIAWLSSYASKGIRRAMEGMRINERHIKRLNRLNKTVLEHAQEGIIVIDSEGTVILFNQQAERYLPDLQINQKHSKVNHVYTIWQNNVYHPFEYNVIASNKELQIKSTPLSEQEPPLLLMSLRSSDEIAQETQAHKLASLGQLTANLAHEIRNPLSAISHANELLMENNIDDVDEHLKHIIEHNVKRINIMVQEILSLNKRDRMNRTIIHLKEFMQNFLTEFILSNPDTVGCLRIGMGDDDLSVFVDEGHLRQILNNLLNNAWKYSKKDANAILVNVSTNPLNNNEVIVQVKDNGAGVSPDYIERIFEPFFTTSSEGTGLGLYVGRELAQANNGHLMYNSTTKTFELIMKKDNAS